MNKRSILLVELLLTGILFAVADPNDSHSTAKMMLSTIGLRNPLHTHHSSQQPASVLQSGSRINNPFGENSDLFLASMDTRQTIARPSFSYYLDDRSATSGSVSRDCAAADVLVEQQLTPGELFELPQMPVPDTRLSLTKSLITDQSVS